MNDRLSFLVGHLIDAVRVNVVSPQTINGQIGWLKRRKIGMDVTISLGNIFLKLSRSRIWMFPNCQAWVQWEIHCFHLLYGDRIQCHTKGNRGFWVQVMPGKSLWQWLQEDELTIAMMEAAGETFRHAHARHTDFFPGGWSHGDCHLANVLYDPKSGTAHLIDFETRHWIQLSTEERQADDLLIFLLDITGRCKNWAELLPIFFQSYNRSLVIRQLKLYLSVPNGWERLLWAIRSNYLSTPQLVSRIAHIRTQFLSHI